VIESRPLSEASEGTRRTVRFGAAVLIALAAVGALLGFVWSSVSPDGPRAYVVSPGLFEPDSTESFVAADARFLIITALVGFVAAVLVWLRAGNRGPVVALALIVGSLLGGLLTELVGHLTGGGTFDGKTNTVIAQLPLSLHMQGLLFVQPAAAALVYGLLAAFADSDDLGHPDPVRESFTGPRAPRLPLVGPGDHPQDGWGHGNAPGALQQGNFPTQ
jgi:hypothetical protein